ncbi:MAG: response regulator [Bacteroidia bacterium]|nr:response regulator [Bacteroidia bacterium]MDW8158829.1 response regulator [Bacteroidia bacterium]
MEKQVILCVDDDRSLLDAIKSELQGSFGKTHSIEVSDSGEDALELLQELLVDNVEVPVVIADHLMPGMKGDEFLIAVHRILPSAKKIMLTGQASSKAVGNAINKASLYRFLSKPWNAADLKLTIEQALKSYQVEKDIQERIQLLNEANLSLQLLSEQIHTLPLIQKLLEFTLERLCASKAIFFLSAAEHYQVPRYFILSPKQNLEVYEARKQNLENKIPEKIIHLAVDQKKTYYVNKLRANTEWKEYEYIQKNKVKAFWVGPIFKGGQVYAVLYLESDAIEFFVTPLKDSFLQLILPQIRIALDNCSLIENLEEKIRKRTELIENQKNAIEDSIRYARRIQVALLPGEKVLKKFFKNAYVFYKPRKIVSGNFYWLANNNGSLYVAVADCTGKGLSGAFMAVFNYSLLNEIFRQNPKASPSQMLQQLHTKQFDQFKEEQAQLQTLRGTEIIISQFDIANQKLTYAGAARNIYLWRQGTLRKFSTSDCKLGFKEFDISHLKDEYLIIEPQDVFYLLTSGIENDLGINGQVNSSSVALFLQLENWECQQPTNELKKYLQHLLEEKEEIQNEDWLLIRISLG